MERGVAVCVFGFLVPCVHGVVCGVRVLERSSLRLGECEALAMSFVAFFCLVYTPWMQNCVHEDPTSLKIWRAHGTLD
jgi:hypothetical protein